MLTRLALIIQVVWWLHLTAPIWRGPWLSSTWTTNQAWSVESGGPRKLTRAFLAWTVTIWTSAKWWKHRPCLKWLPGIRDLFARSPFPLAASRLSQTFLVLGPQSVDAGYCWFMMELLGSIMAQGSTCIKALVFDAHGSHSVIRRVLHGQLSGVSQYDLSRMDFWKELTFKPVPETCLPRFPAQFCLHREEVLYGIPGVCPSDALGGQSFIL